MRPLLGALLLLLALLDAGCGGSVDSADNTSKPTPTRTVTSDPFGPPPATPRGPLGRQLAADLDAVFSKLESTVDRAAVRRIGVSKDPRAAWLLSDLMRFVLTGAPAQELMRSFERVTGTKLPAEDRAPGRAWKAVTDRLITWGLPAPPGYVGFKARLFTLVEPAWAPFFRDRKAAIDWRHVSWGGVFIDDRPLGDPHPCPRLYSRSRRPGSD